MEPQPHSHAARRLTWLAAAILVWAAAIFIKLVLLQVVRHGDYLRAARQQQEMTVEIPAPRGSLLDRNGEVLAMSVPTASVSVNPRQVPDVGIAADILSRILLLDHLSLYGRLRYAHDNERGFLWIKRRITLDQEERLRSLHLDWIDFQTESQRRYPKGKLAANLLGSVDYEESGNSGIEAALDDELCGYPGTARLLTDVKRRGIESTLAAAPQAGTSLTLTLDERIQYVAETEIARTVEEHNAKSGSVVVMNPYTGDILAMANYPTFDPNLPPQRGETAANRFNYAVSVPFEPGSVFKVFTISAALETTTLRPETLIDCGNGALALPGRVIHEASHGYGTIPMALVLAKSSNIGAIKVGMRVGQEKLYEYVRRFGFGQRTGITLPAESPGMVRRLKLWGATSLASVAMGQEIGTTTLQLARGCAVVANGGLLVKPRLVLREGGAAAPLEAPTRAIKPETAITMRQMMEGVVVLPVGTGHKARLAGYTSGGKTGSAQIYDYAAHHYTHTYNGSFMGFAPVTNPAIVVVVTVNGTHGTAGFGGQVAAPVFKVVAEEALRVLDVPKDLPDVEPDTKPAGPESTYDLPIAGLSGEPPVLDEAADQAAAAGPGPKAPDFHGMTMRAVLAKASAEGLLVQIAGSGVARGQQPPPGTALREGERIRVQFSR